MIEPSGQRITLPPNTQTKVPGLGMDQHTVNSQPMRCAIAAQDQAGMGVVSTQIIGNRVHGQTQRLDSCAKAAQDSGSNAAGFQGIAGTINKGAPDWEGTKAQEVVKAGDQSSNALKSVDGNTTPSGRVIDGSNPDQGVASGMLFPGIIE